jgi:hypothetical protein
MLLLRVALSPIPYSRRLGKLTDSRTYIDLVTALVHTRPADACTSASSYAAFLSSRF